MAICVLLCILFLLWFCEVVFTKLFCLNRVFHTVQYNTVQLHSKKEILKISSYIDIAIFVLDLFIENIISLTSHRQSLDFPLQLWHQKKTIGSMTAGLKELAIISAACRSNGIGFKGKLPWRLPKEMAYFTRISSTSRNNSKNAVIMGRKTWDSIPKKFRPLEGRVNVVLSKSLSSRPEGVDYLFSSIEEAVSSLSSISEIDRLFIIGGSSLYEETVKSPLCSKIYLTRIDADFECDTFFPEFDHKVFTETQEEGVPSEVQTENGISYTFHVYSKKKWFCFHVFFWSIIHSIVHSTFFFNCNSFSHFWK